MAQKLTPRQVNGMVRKAVRTPCRGLTKSQSLVLEYLVSLWLLHWSKKGYIHPSKYQIMKRCRLSRDTVRVALRQLRDYRVLTTVSNLRGGKNIATRYILDLQKALEVAEQDRQLATVFYLYDGDKQ